MRYINLRLTYLLTYLLLAQASIDGTTIDKSRCAIDGWAHASAFRFQGKVNGRFGLLALSMSLNTGHLVIVIV